MITILDEKTGCMVIIDDYQLDPNEPLRHQVERFLLPAWTQLMQKRRDNDKTYKTYTLPRNIDEKDT